MNDSKLIQDFIRQKTVGDSVHLLVCMINWDGHTPISQWKVVARVSISDPDEKLEAKISHILCNKQYFGVCKECGERNLRGWMHKVALCQSCAVANHGVIY